MSQANIHIPGLAGANAFTRTLNKEDVDICVSVEQAFTEAERCSKEKVQQVTKQRSKPKNQQQPLYTNPIPVLLSSRRMSRAVLRPVY